MYSTQSDQDISCRTMGRCTYGAARDHETLDLVPRQVDERMTIEERYNAPPIPFQEIWDGVFCTLAATRT